MWGNPVSLRPRPREGLGGRSPPRLNAANYTFPKGPHASGIGYAPVLDDAPLLRSGTNANHSRGDHTKCAPQFGFMIADSPCDYRCLRFGQQPFQPHQDDTSSHTVQPKDQFAEVFINCQQCGLAIIRLPKHVIITDAGREFRDIDDIMAIFP